MTSSFQQHRAMRNARRSAIQRGVVAVLDVGSSKVACLILRVDNMHSMRDDGVRHMGGHASFRVIGAATTRSRGLRFGEVASVTETECAIRTAVQAAQRMANTRVDHVIVCFSGGKPCSYGLTGEVSTENGVVSDKDIARVLSACDMPNIGHGRDVLHAQPVNFTLDRRSALSDPRGQTGNVLMTDVHLLSVDEQMVENLKQCIRRCDLEIAGIVSSAYAAGAAVLVESEQELGAACVDIGGGTTSISIFMKKHMIYVDSVPMGGEHISSDIATGLKVSMAMAERIKTKHGGVIVTGMDDREMIEIDEATDNLHDHDRRKISRSDLIGIIRPRVEEILEEVRERLEAAGFEHLPSQQIVLTGGVSPLLGLADLASDILGPQVRLGHPLRVQGLPQVAAGPAFSSLVGLCLLGVNPKDEWWDFDIVSENYAYPLKKVVRWLKENW